MLNRSENKSMNAVYSTVEQIANDRVARFVRDWRRTRKARVTIQFGNGSELAMVNGKQTGQWDERCPQLILDCLRDVDEITRGHTLAAPDDIDTHDIEESIG